MGKCKHEHGFYINKDEEGNIINAECRDCSLDVM